ncbi:MAG TPA: hypothetical protein VFK94_01425 [Patescibacteria group bacterium]|nr:hypothetical protein [Patescibacteria group bacterium]
MEFLRFHTATQVGETPAPAIARPLAPLGLGGFFNKILSVGTVALAFLVPVFFLPITSEFYEFNKQALLIAATIILTVSWFGRMWSSRELRIVRTPLDLPILLLVAAYVVTTLTSVNLTSSVFGYFGRFNGGLVSVLCYAMLYFVYVNNVRTFAHVMRIAGAMSLSAGVLALFGVLEYFNLFKNAPWDLLKNRFFTPAGSPNALSYYLMAVLPVTLSLLAITKKSSARSLYLMTSLFSFAYIALVNVMAAWIGAAVGLVVFFYFAREATFSRNRGVFTALLVIFLGLSSLALPIVRDRLPQDLREIPKEINLDWGSSWQIAARTIADKPLQGSGPDTFLFDFTRFRDVSLNGTPFWNLRFDRANTELLQVLTTMGLLGLAVFLYFIYRVVRLGMTYLPKEKELETHTLSVGFAAGTLSLVTLMVAFGYLSSVTAFALWLSLAMLVRLWVEEKQVVVRSTVVSVPVGGEGGDSRRDLLPGLVFIPSLILAAFFLFLFGRMYLAEASFQRSLEAARANDGKATYDLQRDTLQSGQVNLGAWIIRLDRDIYHRTFSGTNLLLANSLAGQEKPDSTLIQTLVQQSISSAQEAKNLNPWDVNNWEQLATVYRNLVNFAQGSDQYAEQNYAAAINLDPTNARLHDALGTFYTQVKRYDDAIRILNRATLLKPDLAAAHFDLAKALTARADVEGTTSDRKRDYLTAAKNELEATLKLVTAGSADETEVKKELDGVNKKLAALGGPASTTTTPTVSPTATPSGTRR